jgi:hypothetical protein
MSTSDKDGNDKAEGISRRDALKMSGAAAAGAAALFVGMGAAVPGTASADGQVWTDQDRANFAGMVAKIWKKPSLRDQYNADPKDFLAQYHITLPDGVPAPTIPDKPAGKFGKSGPGSKAFAASAESSFDSWDLTIENMGGTAISVSSLACIACPISSFSSLSN